MSEGRHTSMRAHTCERTRIVHGTRHATHDMTHTRTHAPRLASDTRLVCHNHVIDVKQSSRFGTHRRRRGGGFLGNHRPSVPPEAISKSDARVHGCA